jgi:hypothetical protein
MKDQLRWHNLSVKDNVRFISTVGQLVVLPDEDFNKEKVKAMRMKSSDIADALKAAFGDGL